MTLVSNSISLVASQKLIHLVILFYIYHYSFFDNIYIIIVDSFYLTLLLLCPFNKVVSVSFYGSTCDCDCAAVYGHHVTLLIITLYIIFSQTICIEFKTDDLNGPSKSGDICHNPMFMRNHEHQNHVVNPEY